MCPVYRAVAGYEPVNQWTSGPFVASDQQQLEFCHLTSRSLTLHLCSSKRRTPCAPLRAHLWRSAVHAAELTTPPSIIPPVSPALRPCCGAQRCCWGNRLVDLSGAHTHRHALSHTDTHSGLVVAWDQGVFYLTGAGGWTKWEQRGQTWTGTRVTASFKALLPHVRCHCTSLTGSAGGERGGLGAAGGAAAKGHADVAVQNSLFFFFFGAFDWVWMFVYPQSGWIDSPLYCVIRLFGPCAAKHLMIDSDKVTALNRTLTVFKFLLLKWKCWQAESE